jgi:hypothetical protein
VARRAQASAGARRPPPPERRLSGGAKPRAPKAAHGLAPAAKFRARQRTHALAAGAILTGALALGTLGYHFAAGLAWIDALLNAAMILSGMGPVDPVPTTAGKLFATAYSLFSGVVFLAVVGIVLAPVAHRMLRRFHLDDEER